MKNFFASIILFSVIFGCAKKINYEPYIISQNPQIKRIERGDHDVCVSLKLNFDSQDINQSKLYWRCRLTFAKFRLNTRNTRGSQVQNQQINDEISNLVAQISLKLASDSLENLYSQNLKLDNFHHQRCQKLGYEVDTDDKLKIEEYFTCRKALIDEYNLSAPYGNEEYLKYKNETYDIGFVVDQALTKNLKKQSEALSKYPDCKKYSFRSENFKNCAKAIEDNKQCLAKIPEQIYKKDGQEKILCQKKVYDKYGDELLIDYDKKQQEIIKNNYNADTANGNNLESLGLNQKMFVVESKAKLDEKNTLENDQISLKERRQKINSRTELYSKSELTRLRRIFISSCQKSINQIIYQYRDKLFEDCDKLSEYDEIEDE